MFISSGTKRGELYIRKGHYQRLVESAPYEDDANTVLGFLENHLCSATFEKICEIAQRRFLKKEQFLDRMYKKHQKLTE